MRAYSSTGITVQLDASLYSQLTFASIRCVSSPVSKKSKSKSEPFISLASASMKMSTERRERILLTSTAS